MAPGANFAWVMVVAPIIAVAAEEEEVSAVDSLLALMLIGGVSFVMGLFYLVNHSRKSIKKNTWLVLCSTISIFSAVLVFQAVDGMLDVYVLEGMGKIPTFFVLLLHSLLWMVFLQVFLSIFSHAIDVPFYKHKTAEVAELNMKCWAVLLGHISGFASIHAWAHLQQIVPRNWYCVLLVVPASWLYLKVLYTITDQIREFISKMDDGKIDEYEKLWDEETEETEDDILALTLSFNVVQFLRLLITGILPDKEGNNEEGEMFTLLQCWTLGIIGVLAAIFTMFHGEMCKPHFFARFTSQNRCTCNMVFAWCFMFSVDCVLVRNGFGWENATAGIILALIVTAAAATIMYFLNWLADLECTGASVDKAIHGIILALGLLIGFSWEKCFDIAVGNVAARQDFLPASQAKLILALILATLVTPAWRWYILPKVKELGGFEGEEEGEEDEEKEAGEEKNGTPAGYKLLNDDSKIPQSDSEAPQKIQRLTEESKLQQQQIVELKKRNSELEACVGVLHSNLAELEKVADLLMK